MYGKGASELGRHYKRKTHFRRDQRWRYECLQEIDPVKQTTRHLVRGATGKLLTEDEVEKEYPNFANAELVTLGPTFPYYHDFMSGITTSFDTQDEKTRVQLSVFLKFLPNNGNFSFLRSFWDDVGTVTNHQTTLVGYDWGTERLSVSFSCFSSNSTFLPGAVFVSVCFVISVYILKIEVKSHSPLD